MLQGDAFYGDGRLLLLFSFFLCLAVTPMSPSRADQAAASLQAKFMAAAAENDSVTVQELLAQGVDTESRDANGRSALLLATHHNAVDVARISRYSARYSEHTL